MEKNKALVLSSFFTLVGMDVDYEAIIRKTVEKHGLEITREDLALVRQAWYPSPEWFPAELELHRILGI